MVALLVMMNVMAVMLTVALPAWQTLARREKEAELVFRGEQYARAIALFQRKYGGAFPPNIDALITDRLLRKKYLDPITKGEFALLTPGSVIAASSTSPILPGRSGSTPAPATGGRGGSPTAATAGRGGSFSIAQTFSVGGATGGRATTGRGAANAQPATGGQTTSGTITRSLTFSGNAQTGGATGGIVGVRSRSTEKSLRTYNGGETYDAWLFQASQMAAALSGVGGAAPGGGRGRGEAGFGGRGQQGGGGGARGGPVNPGRRGQTAPPPPPPPAPPGRGFAPARGGGAGGRRLF
jgi:type II secretory pathway pseudopilin PulG